MPRIGKFLPFMLALISVVAIFMFGLIPSSHASPDFDNFKAKTDVRYTLKIDENHRTVTVEATFENLEKKSVEIGFPGGDVFKDSDADFKILSSDSPVARGDFKWEINVGSDNQVFLRYKVMDFSDMFTDKFLYTESTAIFAVPLRGEVSILDYKKAAKVDLKVPENWTPFTTYKKIDNTTFKARNLHELVRGSVIAADVRYKRRGNFYGTETIFMVPKKPSGFDIGYALSHKYDLNIPKDVETVSKRVAYANKWCVDHFNVVPLQTLLVSSFRAGGRGSVHYDGPRRELIDHDVGKFYFPEAVATPIGYFQQFYDSKIATDRTGKKRFLGKIYAMYLTYERGLKRRLKEGLEGLDENLYERPVSVVYRRIKGYGYHSIIASYLDSEIKDETENRKSLADVLDYLYENCKYSSVSKSKYIHAIKKVTGIDLADFFKKHVYGDYEIPVGKYERKYKDDFKKQLDYFRRYNEAPDILYYAYIEIAGNRGIPEYYFYQAPTLIGKSEGSHAPALRYFRKFLTRLSTKDHLSKSEFIQTIDKFTDNTSDDFFEFYSKYGPRKPSIKALNWWLDGDYDSIVRRKVYTEKSLEKLSNMDSKVSQFESELKNIRSLLENAENLLNSHQLNESLKKYKKAIEDIHRIREQDDDGDGLADINEGSYGLDPNNEDSDGDGLADNREVRTIKLDGFAQEWWNINAKSAKETEGIIKEIETARTENYVNIRVKYSKPLYTLKNSQINFDFDFNQDWSDGSDRYSFTLGGPNVPIEGSLDSSLENYVYVGRQNLEFKIPVETLEILKFPKKASLRVYIRSDLEGPEYGDGWDTDLGWGQINNVKILGESQEKADFEIYDLNIGKKKLKLGESVKVSVNVANLGKARGSKTVDLSINGRVVKSENVVLEPDENRLVSFEISRDEEGTYEFSVEGLNGSFEVVGPPKFKVSNLSIDKEEVKLGESTTISVKVSNTGGKEGTYDAELSINGEVKTQSVTLNPDESEKVTFKISREKAGTYEVNIGELSKTFNVKKPGKAEKGIPWLTIAGVIVAVIVISAFVLYRRK